MPKITVETKSRSKHVFEVEDDVVEWFVDTISQGGFKGITCLKIQNTFFNPENVTSIKIEE